MVRNLKDLILKKAKFYLILRKKKVICLAFQKRNINIKKKNLRRLLLSKEKEREGSSVIQVIE